MKRRRAPARRGDSGPGVVLGPRGPYVPASTSRVVEAVAEREYSPAGTLQREWLATRTTETRQVGGLAAELPPPPWYRTWVRVWGGIVVAVAWLVWATLIVFGASVLTLGAIHLWGPGGVWLAAGAMFLIWWCSLVRRAWREQERRDPGRGR